MNLYAVRAIYLFEMHRTWRTLLQSIASPVISTSLYFVVFGSAIGSRIWLRWMSVEPVWATLHYNSTFAACRLPLVFV